MPIFPINPISTRRARQHQRPENVIAKLDKHAIKCLTQTVTVTVPPTPLHRLSQLAQVLAHVPLLTHALHVVF